MDTIRAWPTRATSSWSTRSPPRFERPFPPGTRLPTHRQLAAKEGLALVTATRVYAELEAMGLVSGETGRGTFVREASLPPAWASTSRALAATWWT